MKTCGRCKIEKPFYAFSKCATRKDGHQSRCKECTSVVMGNYRATHLEDVKARSALDYEKHADAYRQRAKSRYEQQRDVVKRQTAEYQRQNKDKKAVWSLKYRVANKHKDCAKTAKRKSRRLLATPAWSDEKAIRAIYREAERMTKETGVPHHVDHIVPLQSEFVCGLHCESNLQIIHASENMSKNNRHWPDMP